MRKMPGERKLSRKNDAPVNVAMNPDGWERSDMIKGLILGILLGAVLIAGSVYYYFSSGHAPVATSAPPKPLEKTYARIGLQA
jgi:hypothetical protein